MGRPRAALLPALMLLARATLAAEPTLPTPRGFVTDVAGVLSPATSTKITRLAEELQAKTGAEIAVAIVRTTAPLDDFTYAMKLAEAWRPGRKREDTGVLFLVAVDDRKVRILVGYGLEGILPDGRTGEIIDREVVPAFRAGSFDDGVLGGVAAVARVIAADRGVALTGVPPPRQTAEQPLPAWVPLVVFLVLLAIVLYQSSRQQRFSGRGGYPPWGFGGPFGGGGFGGGGGGFGGFGGGSFGGGGAGRSW